MKQRMVMVLSTLLDPSLLIADEITSALDVSTQKAVAEMLVEFRERGFVKSMIVITHDISILYQVADTILVMYAGQLAEKAPAERDHRCAAAPVHEAPDLVAARGGRRYAEKRLVGIPARRRRCSSRRGMPVPGPLPARDREVQGAAAVRRGRRRPSGRLLGGGRMSATRPSSTAARKVYKVGAFGGEAG